MSELIVYIDSSEIRGGKLEQLKAAVKELVEFVKEREPQLISYNFYINETGTRISVVAVHPDAASLEFHLNVAGPAFRKFTEMVNLSTIEIYGQPGVKVLEQLHQKARLLGNGTVIVHDQSAGFTRSGSISRS